jgi:FkbM family methyltransferase
MKNFIHACLCRMPRLYAALGRRTGSIEKRVFLNLLSNGDVVLDIGANTGHFTLLFSHIVGSSGEVHAFEPVPPTFAVLKENLARRCWYRNVTVNNLALSDSAGEVPMYLPNKDHGQASLAKHHAGSWSNNAPVETFQCHKLTLDEYARSLTRRINFIKIDVEGAELLVLKGAAATLRKDRPTIFFEISDDWSKGFGYTPEDVLSHLRSCGYTEFHAVTNNVFRLEPNAAILPSCNVIASLEGLPKRATS